MLLCDNAVMKLIAAAGEDRTDVFLIPAQMPSGGDIAFFAELMRGGTLCVLPGAPVFPSLAGDAIRRDGAADGLLFVPAADLADDGMADVILRRGIRRMLVLFAENADPGSGVWTASMRYIAELRAALPVYVQVVALFASDITGSETRFASLFGSKHFAIACRKKQRVIRPERFRSREGTYFYAAGVAERSDSGRTVIFFADRSGAAEFAAFLRKNGAACPVFHGGMTYEAGRGALDAFLRTDNGVIAVTKSFLPTALFCDACSAVFCGVPSDARLPMQIMSAVTHTTELTCAFCPDDITRAEGRMRSYAAAARGSVPPVFLRSRQRALEDIKNILIR